MSPNAMPLVEPAPAAVAAALDCEPPAVGGPPVLPPVTASRPRTRLPPPTEPHRAGPQTRAAAAFADAALRRVLEVIDRRRPLAQLRPLLAAGLVDSLLSGGTGGTAVGTASLRRVIAQLSRSDGSAAEISATYARGTRVHAIACRIEQLPTATGPRWQLVALHLG